MREIVANGQEDEDARVCIIGGTTFFWEKNRQLHFFEKKHLSTHKDKKTPEKEGTLS